VPALTNWKYLIYT